MSFDKYMRVSFGVLFIGVLGLLVCTFLKLFTSIDATQVINVSSGIVLIGFALAVVGVLLMIIIGVE
jgi:uncharacterized membrane protein YGL010W